MKSKTRSFIKRIALGGALSSAMSLLMGCAVIGDSDVAVEGEPETIGERLAKVDVCHEPPGNPDNAHTITVSDSSLVAHGDHGDSTSACNAGGELPFDSLLMCHSNGDGTFSEVLVDGASVSDRLAAGDIIGTCPQMLCGDS